LERDRSSPASGILIIGTDIGLALILAVALILILALISFDCGG